MPTGTMTIERLAQISQEQFLSLRGDITSVRADVTSVQGEVTSVRQEMRDGFAHVDVQLEQLRVNFGALRDDIQGMFQNFGESMKEELKKYQYAPEIDDLRARVVRLEEPQN